MDIPAAPELGAMLRDTKVYEFSKSDGVRVESLVDVPEDMNAAKVLETMSSHNLSAVPVYREEAQAVPGLVGAGFPGTVAAYVPPTEKKYLGWVSSGDIAALQLVKGLREKSGGILAAIKAAFSSDEDHAAKAALNFSNTDPFWALPVGRSMDQTVRVMGRCNLHRLAVVDTDDKNRVCGLLTQSAVVKFLSACGKLGPLGAMPMSEFVKTGRSVTSVRDTATAREALATIIDNKISGVPIVDADGVILSSVSVNDLRALGKVKPEDEGRLLGLPVTDFVTEVRALSHTSSTKPPSTGSVTVLPTDSFATALELAVNSRVHRLFIVDDARRPIGVMTLTDALRAVANSCC
jgi:CBS domain-containing protein